MASLLLELLGMNYEDWQQLGPVKQKLMLSALYDCLARDAEVGSALVNSIVNSDTAEGVQQLRALLTSKMRTDYAALSAPMRSGLGHGP